MTSLQIFSLLALNLFLFFVLFVCLFVCSCFRVRPIRSLRANEPHHDVTYDKECDVTEEPHFSYRSCSQCSLLLDGLCFQVLRLVRVRFF